MVKQDPDVSPTGYPFQVVQTLGSLSEMTVFEEWHRECNVQGLHTPHRMRSGQLVYRCPAEPIRVYHLMKEGELKDTEHARCLCRGLLSAIRCGDPGDAPIYTLGRNSESVKALAVPPNYSYTAAQAMNYLLGVG